MIDLTKYARDKPCDIRVPGRCCFDPTASVWAHLRMIGISAAGMKACDILGCVACHVCHDIVDFRKANSEFTYQQRRLFLLEGVARRQVILIENRVLTW